MKLPYEEYLKTLDGQELPYMLIVDKDYQIILYNCQSPYDPFDTFDDEPDNTTDRVIQNKPHNGMIIYKALARAVYRYLWKYRPPMFYFNTDMDESRSDLYNFFAQLIEKKCNYTCYYKDGSSFYFVRTSSNK